MADVLDLDEARTHLGAGDEISDLALLPYIAAAEAAVAEFLGRRSLVGAGAWDDREVVPATVVHAVKLVLADLFDDRNTPLSDMTAVRHLCGAHIRTSFA